MIKSLILATATAALWLFNLSYLFVVPALMFFFPDGLLGGSSGFENAILIIGLVLFLAWLAATELYLHFAKGVSL